MVKYYDQDLAYIHDIGFGDWSKKATPEIINFLYDREIKNGLVVDLGCGSGILAHELSSAGFDVLGIDISEDMINIARKRAPKCNFITKSFLDVDIPKCNAVTSIGECFNYLFDKKNSKNELIKLFNKIFNSLYSDGLFIFDIIEPGLLTGNELLKNFWKGSDWVTLVRKTEDINDNILKREITSFRRIGKEYRRSDEVHCLKLYKGSEIAIELRKIGFRVRILRGFGVFRFPKNHVAFVARKP